MMKIAKINLGKNRVLLSDVLPYELPIIFSNRHFLNFVNKYKLRFSEEKLFWRNDTSSVFDKFIKLLFDIPNNTTIRTVGDIKQVNVKNFIKIPFQFEITHKIDSYRKLSLVHPFNQLQMVDFYDKYKEFILYLCNRSSFSIRHPSRLAEYRYYRDRLHIKNLSTEELGIEQYEEEYENLKSFFVYEKYSNIHKFYDDFIFNRCEKKYNYLLKLDITRCFDSIYTHTISWAIYGKNYTKNNNFAQTSFGDIFDKLMQNLNYQETNGIVIGPEFSRIFSEIILQQVDKDVLMALQKKELVEKRDFEIFRYVDDFFVFFNKDEDKQSILSELQHSLSCYNLHLNEAKEEVYKRPIISNISIAKHKIRDLLDTTLNYEIIEKNDKDKETKSVKLYINSKTFIVAFKTIIKESGVEYKDILNYTLSIIENKLRPMFVKFSELCKDPNVERKFFNALQHLLECVAFMYSCSPRVNSTIRFSRIIKMFIFFLRRKSSNVNYKGTLFAQIYNDIMIVMHKTCPNEYTQIETSYLLIILQELGKEFDLSEKELASYFGIDLEANNCQYSLNYLSIIILLFYIRGKKKYNKLMDVIIKNIKDKLIVKPSSFKKCEDFLLFLDVLACPYISVDIKREILTNHGIVDTIEQDEIIGIQNKWFVSWQGFNLKQALDAKKGQEVY